MKNETVKKVRPHHIQERLSRDVHAILSVCIQHFDDADNQSKEKCFDVDAVITGRSVEDTVYTRRVRPVRYTRPIPSNAPSTLSTAQKGYFIPYGYASALSFA